MDHRTPTFSIERPHVGQVVKAMKAFAHKGKEDLRVRGLVEQICGELESGDYASECLAIYQWVSTNIRYIRDIHDVEFLKEPAQLLATPTGDCDDIATLIAAMLMAAGNECDFVLVSYAGPTPTHVYTQARTMVGPVILDPVANTQAGKMLRSVKHKWVFPV